MEKIRVTFLGTGNAIPTKKRNHTAILLNYKNENILVDCGEGTQRQFRMAGISPAKLTRILITHWHGDHILGLPGLFQTLAMTDYQKTLHVYGPRGTKRFVSLLSELIKIQINLEVHEVGGKFIDEKDFYIEAKSMKHGTPTLGYSFVIKDKFRLDKGKLKRLKLPHSPLLKKLQQGNDVVIDGEKIKASGVSYLEKGRKVTLILDTALNEGAISLAKGCDLLVCEASFSEKEKKMAEERNHLTASDAGKIAKKAGAGKTVLTHISQRYEHAPKIILDEAKKVFKKTMLVNDFDVVEL